MKTLRSAKLDATLTLALNIEEDGYRRSTEKPWADVEPEKQLAIQSAIAWMVATYGLPGETFVDGIVEPAGTVVATWSEDDPPEALSTRQVLSIAVTFSAGANGRTITFKTENAPVLVRDGLLATWADWEES